MGGACGRRRAAGFACAGPDRSRCGAWPRRPRRRNAGDWPKVVPPPEHPRPLANAGTPHGPVPWRRAFGPAFPEPAFAPLACADRRRPAATAARRRAGRLARWRTKCASRRTWTTAYRPRRAFATRRRAVFPGHVPGAQGRHRDNHQTRRLADQLLAVTRLPARSTERPCCGRPSTTQRFLPRSTPFDAVPGRVGDRLGRTRLAAPILACLFCRRDLGCLTFAAIFLFHLRQCRAKQRRASCRAVVTWSSRASFRVAKFAQVADPRVVSLPPCVDERERFFKEQLLRGFFSIAPDPAVEVISRMTNSSRLPRKWKNLSPSACRAGFGFSQTPVTANRPGCRRCAGAGAGGSGGRGRQPH